MPEVLTRIKPMHGPVVPAPNWTPAGVTPDGRQLFIERFKTNDAVPDYLPPTADEIEAAKREGREPQGERRWRRHPINAEPLVPMNKRNIIDVERMFYVDSQGNFNQEKMFYTPPTPEELAAAKREGKMEAVMRKLAEGLVDSPLDPDEIVARLLKVGVTPTREEYESAFDEAAQQVVVPEPADELGDVDATEYPLSVGKNKWQLSSGIVFKGNKKEAEAVELEIMQAREDAEETPDF
jgi:hypothetical protein